MYEKYIRKKKTCDIFYPMFGEKFLKYTQFWAGIPYKINSNGEMTKWPLWLSSSLFVIQFVGLSVVFQLSAVMLGFKHGVSISTMTDMGLSKLEAIAVYASNAPMGIIALIMIIYSSKKVDSAKSFRDDFNYLLNNHFMVPVGKFQ